MRPIDLDLPLGSTTIKRLRSSVGMMWYEDRAKWWEERLPEMATMSATDFARKHEINVATACLAMIRYFGHANRPPGWWREKDAADTLLSGRPSVEIASALGIAPSSVRRLRSALMHDWAGS
ncbi:hypothetical protein AtDm6_0263 [Acetobacter tropicalis]|uniref:Uncharacterized protein n=2 Tax=Acetobacter tropicalis TaxID=104102 RepID=A0A094ZWD4_9PROT|nr:hypothetical protein AtDm6_0263 [Acetobacter tropicalis]